MIGSHLALLAELGLVSQFLLSSGLALHSQNITVRGKFCNSSFLPLQRLHSFRPFCCFCPYSPQIPKNTAVHLLSHSLTPLLHPRSHPSSCRTATATGNSFFSSLASLVTSLPPKTRLCISLSHHSFTSSLEFGIPQFSQQRAWLFNPPSSSPHPPLHSQQPSSTETILSSSIQPVSLVYRSNKPQNPTSSCLVHTVFWSQCLL
jgi:hypothetical protein